MTIALDLSDAVAHTWIVGSNSAGKTTTLLYRLRSMAEDHQKELPCSVIFIDPHGDAAIGLAQSLGSWENLTILDPGYVSFGLNPLELPRGLDGEGRAAAVQTQVAQLESILWEVFEDDLQTAPRMLTIFRTGLYFLYGFGDRPTFRDLFDLFLKMLKTEKRELTALLRLGNVKDEMIARTMEALASLEKDAFSPGINRLANFVMPGDSLTARTFNEREPKLDFEGMLEPGRVTIFRLANSDLPDFTKLVTTAVMVRLFLIVRKRAWDLERQGRGLGSRTPVILAIDEFQNVAGLKAIPAILAEARKFGLYLWMAHQNLSQLNAEVLNALMGNAGTVFAYRVGPEDARRLAGLMHPNAPEELARYLSAQPNHHVVVRKNPVSGSSPFRTFSMEYPEPCEPKHSESEVIGFMEDKMEKLYGSSSSSHPVSKVNVGTEVEKDQTRRPPPEGIVKRVLSHLAGKGFTTRRELAASCDSSVRSVSRVLAYVETQRLVERQGRSIRVTEAGLKVLRKRASDQS
jgi:hypothetical protein